MYITTREMVISIICNACGVLGLILWAIEAHKSNANQRTQSVESVENNGDIIVRSNLEPFRVDEPQTEMTTEQIVNELLSIKKILADGKMPKQTHEIRTNTHECVKDTHDKTEPQTEKGGCTNCDGKDLCNNAFTEISQYCGAYEPQTTDYCDVCDHKGCDNCIADGSNPYCVPSQFEPQTERRCGNCKHLTYRWNKTWCDIKCDNPHDMVCDKWERSE